MAQVKNLWDLLRKRYPQEAYALMAEVSNAAGFSRSNSADYIAVGLWPSRGLHISGIELKSFRGDWLSELRKPDKAESIFKYCDYWWLLTTDDHVAKMEEIPATWGWMCVAGSRITVKKEAPKLSPCVLDRHFLAAMLKRAADKTGFVHINSIDDKIEAAKTQVLATRDRENKYRLEKYEELKKIVSEFEESSGLKFGTWSTYNPKKIGDACKFITNGGVPSIKKELEGLKITADHVCKKINSSLEIFNSNVREPNKEISG